MNGKSILVTGGTAGIGFEAAKLLAARGAVVTITGRSAERGEKAAAALRELGAQCHYVRGELGDPEDAARVVADAAAAMGNIDAAVCSGAEVRSAIQPFEAMQPAQMKNILSSLLYPKLFPVHAVIPYLKQAGGGSIVMIGTDAARHPTPGESMVGAAGAVVILLAKVLAKELSRDRIRVNSVALTITSDTPAWDRVFAGGFSEKVFAKAVSRFPYGRAPKASEVAEAIAFLSSDAAGQISGQTISVNGALSFGGW